MGYVLEGYEPELQRWLAIKVMFSGQGGVNEPAMIANLDHRNLVHVYDSGATEGGRPYYVMTRVAGAEGLDLDIGRYYNEHPDRSRIEWRGGSNRLLQHIVSALEGLEYLHSRGVVHRDIKPSNLLLSNPLSGEVHGESRQRLYVTDFGLAQRVGVGTKRGAEGQVVFEGTPLYAAPEQVRPGGEITPQTDVYQLGLVLRQVMTNARPFSQLAVIDSGVLGRLIEGRTPKEVYGDPLLENRWIPRELVAVVHKALAMDPGERYGSAAEFRRDIEAFIRGRRVEAYAESLGLFDGALYGCAVTARGVKEWVRHNQRVCALLTLGAVGAGGVGWSRYQSQEVEAEARGIVSRASDLGKYATEMAGKGNLDTAVATLSPELLKEWLEARGDVPEVRKAVEELSAQRLQWERIITARRLVTEAMCGNVGEEPGDLGKPTYTTLMRAREQFLPDGATPEGIAAFKGYMDRASYTPQQRLEIMVLLAQIERALMGEGRQRAPWAESFSEEERRRSLAQFETTRDICLACGVGREEGGDATVPHLIITGLGFLRESLGGNQTPEHGLRPSPAAIDGNLKVYLYPEVSTPKTLDSLRLYKDIRLALVGTPADPFIRLYAARYEMVVNGSGAGTDARSTYDSHMRAFDHLRVAYHQMAELGVDNFNVGVQLARLGTKIIDQSRLIPLEDDQDARPVLLLLDQVMSDLRGRYGEDRIRRPDVLIATASSLAFLGRAPRESDLRYLESIPECRSAGRFFRLMAECEEVDDGKREMVDSSLAREVLDTPGAYGERDLLSRATLMVSMGRYDDALGALQMLLMHDPRFVEPVRLRRNGVFFKLKSYEGGEPFNRLLEMYKFK
jgi:hypothetical protein